MISKLDMKLYLETGEDIILNENARVHQPTVKDIVRIGESRFNKMILCYTLTTSVIFGGLDNGDKFIDRFNMFDLFFLKDENNYCLLDSLMQTNALELLLDSLSLFLGVKKEDIQVLENRAKIVVSNSYLIDNNEFNKLRKVVQALTLSEDLEPEEVPKNMTARQLDIYNKLKAGRERKKKREALYLPDFIRFAKYGGKSYISKKEILEMTYYELRTSYQNIMNVESYLINTMYATSMKYDMKPDELKHWSETIRIRK